MINKLLYTFAAILCLLAPARGQEARDSVVVSLLTCWPGPAVYELCGHEAIRVRGEGVDSVWNYGVFDFGQPNFIYRFVTGRTDYMVSAYPTWVFLQEYGLQHRRVVEQDLNLRAGEARALHAMLRENARPENRMYRYNYVKDNCATRITAMLDKASGRRIVYPDSVKYGTFRNEMRAYHVNYPWYQFGIDLALGSGIDYPLRGREEMFVPLEMMEKSGQAHFEDGTPLVSAERVLNEGSADATEGPTPWAATPLFCCWALLALMVALCVVMWRRGKVFRLLYTLWYGMLGVAGCVVSFLVFASSHEATSPNVLLLWLNPLQFILAAFAWCRGRWRIPAVAMAYTDVIVTGVLMIVWPMQPQSANPAFFPLMGATLVSALTFAIISSKTSYIKSNSRKHEEVSYLGAGRSGHTGRGRSGRGRTSASGGGNRR